MGGLLLRSYGPQSHLEEQLDAAEFENAFKDSGYWDYALQSLYDAAFRTYFVYTLLYVTDYAISEKASWVLLGGVMAALTNSAFLELSTLSEFFLYVAAVIIFFFFINFFWASVLSLV